MSDLENDLEDGEIESDEEMPPQTLLPELAKSDQQLNPSLTITMIANNTSLSPTVTRISTPERIIDSVSSKSTLAPSSNPFSNKEKAIVAARAAEEFEAAAEALAKNRKVGQNKAVGKSSAQKRKRTLDAETAGGLDGEFYFNYILFVNI